MGESRDQRCTSRADARGSRPLLAALAAGLIALFASPRDQAAVFGQEVLPGPRGQAPNQARLREVVPALPQESLGLSDLEEMALTGNPTLAQATAAIAQQRGTWRQVGLYPNPLAGYIRSDAPAGQQRTNGLFLSQEIVTAKKRQLSRAVEAREIQRLSWEQEAQRQRVLNDLRIRYYEVLGAQQAILISRDLLGVAEEGVRIADELLKAEQGTRTDLLQARIQSNIVRSGLQDAHYRYDAAWRQLADIVGFPAMRRVHLEGRLDEIPPRLDFEQALRQLLAASPQLRASEAELNHARAELARERANRVPNVTLQTVTAYDQLSGATLVNALVAAPLPLYNRNQGNIDHATADIRVAQAEIARVRLVLRDQLSDSFRRYQSAHNQVERLRKSILPDAKENLDLTTEGYKEGEFNFLQVLNARQTWIQSNLAHVEAVTELRKVIVEISGLQLTGGLNPATLGAAIQTTTGTMQQRGLLKQLQDSSSKQLLPAAAQAIAP